MRLHVLNLSYAFLVNRLNRSQDTIEEILKNKVLKKTRLLFQVRLKLCKF